MENTAVLQKPKRRKREYHRAKIYTIRLQILVSKKMYEEIKQLAEEEGRTISEIGRQMFAEYIRYIKNLKGQAGE